MKEGKVERRQGTERKHMRRGGKDVEKLHK